MVTAHALLTNKQKLHRNNVIITTDPSNSNIGLRTKSMKERCVWKKNVFFLAQNSDILKTTLPSFGTPPLTWYLDCLLSTFCLVLALRWVGPAPLEAVLLVRPRVLLSVHTAIPEHNFQFPWMREEERCLLAEVGYHAITVFNQKIIPRFWHQSCTKWKYILEGGLGVFFENDTKAWLNERKTNLGRAYIRNNPWNRHSRLQRPRCSL